MLRTILAIVISALGSAAFAAGTAFTMNPAFLRLPPGLKTTGDSHGDIAISPAGEIYISVAGGPFKGIQVYSADGQYLRNVPNAPSDFHGFVITSTVDGTPSIYGASLQGQRIVQLSLTGEIVLTIPALSIPDEYKTREGGKLTVALTGVAIGPNGDIYAVDGYGRDFIHRFDRMGRYRSTFGGKREPWKFSQCHKITYDPRFVPGRLICTDRLNDQLIHLDLDGNVLGTFGQGLRRPSALAIRHDELAVAELGGRVSILDRNGNLIKSIGTNPTPEQTQTNTIAPEQWRPDRFYAPHGITYDSTGHLLVTEWSQWGRVVLIDRHGQP